MFQYVNIATPCILHAHAVAYLVNELRLPFLFCSVGLLCCRRATRVRARITLVVMATRLEALLQARVEASAALSACRSEMRGARKNLHQA